MPNIPEAETAFPSPEQFHIVGHGHYTYASPEAGEMSYNLEFKHDVGIDDWMSTIKVSHSTGEGAYFASLHRTFADAYESAFKHILAEGGSSYVYQDSPRSGKTFCKFDDFKKTNSIKPPNEGPFAERQQAPLHTRGVMPPTR